jgi:hypothetical protein
MSKKLLDEKLNEDAGDKWFLPSRYPNSPRTEAMMVNVRSQCLEAEVKLRIRGRRRKEQDLRSWSRQVEAIVCEAIYHHLESPKSWIAISLSKTVLGCQGRYGSPVLSKTLPEAIKLLASPLVRLLEFELGFWAGHKSPYSKQSRFRAGKELIRVIKEAGIDLSEFVRRDEGEVIVLRKGKERSLDKAKAMPYEDTALTNRYRQEIASINTWLAEADLDLCLETTAQHVDIDQRYLKRIFNNGSFSEGGRLYGGFWMNLSKKQRSEGLIINGNSVAVLDFGQMGARILYGMVGHEPTFADAYSLPQLSGKHRATVKKVFNAMLNADKGLTRFPADTKPKDEWVGITTITQSILSFHQPIAHLFYSGVGLKVLFRESEITISILTRLKGMGIVALPIHDALIVEQDHQEVVKQVMLSTFKELTGISGQVSVDNDDSSVATNAYPLPYRISNIT